MDTPRSSTKPVPAGFQAMNFQGEFDQAIAPLYFKRNGVEITLGLRVESRHCNYSQILHGGALASFVDVAMGSATRAASRGTLRIVTSSLAIDYLGSAVAGDWVEATGRVLRQGKRLVVVECLVYKGTDVGKPELIARTNGTYAPIDRPGMGPNNELFADPAG